tara:strand:+ start:324 stop:704 length:381 start_codon:yes stop_codon:yes gene_type:complete
MTDIFRAATPAQRELCWSVFVTALEGGIGYWSQCHRYRWADANGEPDHIGFHALIDDEGHTEGLRCIDSDVMAKGFMKLMDDSVKLSSAIRGRMLAAWFSPRDADFDAEDADVVVQLGLYGEVIFG